jgi:segregation and condensation protein B
MNIENIIEAIIFASEEPVKKEEFQEIFAKIRETQVDFEPVTDADLDQLLATLTQKYETNHHSFEIRKIANAYQFFTKPTYYPYIKQAILVKNQKRLSKAALEALSIIAYKQPITKAEIEHIRGVNSDYGVQKLLERKLILISGRANAPGKPLLYSTSEYFLQYLGINHIADLPKLKEFEATSEQNLSDFVQVNNDNSTHN